MHLLDLSHTSHTRARTGIQRVCRALHRELTGQADPITWDPYLEQWRQLESWENANLSAQQPAARRSAAWPWNKRLRSRFRRLGAKPNLPTDGGLIVPELFSGTVGAALPKLNVAGPRIALFHDAIAIKLPELSPMKTVARFPAYLQELLQFDGIAAVSEDSRRTLVDYWNWLGIAQPPVVTTIPLGLDLPPSSPSIETVPPPPVVLCVGSIEGRKNHLALLEAAESLWQQGRQFTLRLIGLTHPQTGRGASEKIASLQAAAFPVQYDGAVDDAALEAAYAGCAFTIYPSLMEGFGLPVLESLSRGRPCICAAHGALGESARGGGALMLDQVDARSLAAAIDRLLQNPALIRDLTSAAKARKFRSWKDYTTDLLGWMKSLR